MRDYENMKKKFGPIEKPLQSIRICIPQSNLERKPESKIFPKSLFLMAFFRTHGIPFIYSTAKPFPASTLTITLVDCAPYTHQSACFSHVCTAAPSHLLLAFGQKRVFQ